MSKTVNLSIESSAVHINAETVWHHKIGKFAEIIDITTARFLSELVYALVLPGEKALVGLCPFYENEWDNITKSAWKTLAQRAEQTKQRTTRPSWVVGHTDERDKFSEIFRYGWNVNIDEAFVICVAPADDNGLFLLECETKGDIYPGHEEALLNRYPTVLSRYYDGLWMTILSTRVSSEEILKLLDSVSRSTISVTVENKRAT